MPRALLTRPHHDGASLHVGNDAPSLGETVPMFLRVPRDDGLTGAWARTTPDGEPHLLAGRVDRETAIETWWCFDVKVRNPLTGYRFLLGGGEGGYRWLNGTGVHHHDVTDAHDFRLSSAPPPGTTWWRPRAATPAGSCTAATSTASPSTWTTWTPWASTPST